MDYLDDIVAFFQRDPMRTDFNKNTLKVALSRSREITGEDDFLNQFEPDEINTLLEYFPFRSSINFYNFAYEFLLKNKINSLTSPTKYSNIIDNYFNKLFNSDGIYVDLSFLNLQHYTPDDQKKRYLPPEEKYKLVLSSFSNLWVSSEKSPSLFQNASEFEPILQRNMNYREHFIHSFNVFLLGYYIINKLLDIKPKLFEHNRDVINLTWMLASTFHDVAYPIQEIESWLNDMLKIFIGINPRYQFKVNELIPAIYTDFLRMISQYHKDKNLSIQSSNMWNIDYRFFNEMNTRLIENKEHGVLGALLLAHLLAVRQGFSDRNPPWDFLYSHLPACHAISVHHLENIPIKFTKNQFAFLLILCDEIQDWGRPSTNKNRDIFYLKDINIINDTVPTIELCLNISDNRKDLLKNKLSKERLIAEKNIKIIIKDTNDNIILDIDN